MWCSFVVLFTIATIGLEVFEGNKITTTEYYGLRNLESSFILVISLFVIAVYPVSFLPLTMIITRFVNPFIARVIIYTLLGGISGIWVFHKLYGFADKYYINGYELERNNAIFIFGIAGLLYSLVDNHYKVNQLLKPNLLEKYTHKKF